MIISGRFSKVWVALLLLITASIGCAVKQREVVGTFVTDEGTIEVRQDGTFQTRSHGVPISFGHWKLTDHITDTGLELDSATEANDYLLARRGGTLCMQVEEDIVYWCKAN